MPETSDHIQKLINALHHCQNVFISMAERGDYPKELLPGTVEFMGVAGYKFIEDAINGD